ncbi:MAG: dTMP kinase [Rubricoccaceae bacterium]|nr:dTMP kinase [Rubricoccaceae bacterium]
MLITFEGIDGCGKSTQARLLEQRLTHEGYPVLLVREPGGVPLGEEIRSILLGDRVSISPFAELLLFSAARAQLVREKIVPSLHAGSLVICDRFFDSTTAYQGAGRGLADPEWLSDFHLKVTGGIVPDVTFLIDIPLEVANERRSDRDTEKADRMEAGGDDFFGRVRDAYLQLAESNQGRFVVLDGTGTQDQLHLEIVQHVLSILNVSS